MIALCASKYEIKKLASLTPGKGLKFPTEPPFLSHHMEEKQNELPWASFYMAVLFFQRTVPSPSASPTLTGYDHQKKSSNS